MGLVRISSDESGMESQIYNKIAARVLPYFLLLYMVAFIDRVNVSFAKLSMSADIGLSDTAYGIGAGICFIGICLFEIPSNVILQRVGARFWIARIMVVWGLICIAMAWVGSTTSFYVLRLALGVAEAGLFPGILYFISQWFPAKLRGQTTAIFLLSFPLSGIIGAPICGWLMAHMGGIGLLKDWQWLFILTGAPAVVLGFFTYFFLQDSPEQARWLSPPEKEVLRAVRQKEASSSVEPHRLRDALYSGTMWLLALVCFTIVLSNYSISFWLPQMVSNLGIKDKFHIGLIVSIPSVFGAIGVILIGQSSDRHRERRWHIAGCLLLAAIGLAAVGWSGQNLWMLVMSFSFALFGLTAGVSLLFTLPGLLATGVAAAAGFALVSTLGNAAGIVGPAFVGWVMQVTGHAEKAFLVFASLTLISAVVIASVPALGRKYRDELADAAQRDSLIKE